MSESIKNFALPSKIAKTAKNELLIQWTNGDTRVYGLRDLRLACPCASCVDEWSGKKILDPNSVSESIEAKKIRSVGRYAMVLEWSDGHDSGIYSYDYLMTLGKKI